MTGPAWLLWPPVAVRLGRETGRYRPADTLARLAGDATRALAELPAAPQPTPPVDQAADP